jgi:hypothetical protein
MVSKIWGDVSICLSCTEIDCRRKNNMCIKQQAITKYLQQDTC